MSDERVIRIVCLADGRPSAFAGRYLVTYDLEAREGRGLITTSGDPSDAMRFPSAMAALDAWQARSHTVPNRPDGQANRPLTAFTVEIESLVDAFAGKLPPALRLGWLLVWTGHPETDADAAAISYLGRRFRGAGCAKVQGGSDYLAGYGPVEELDRVAAWAVGPESPAHWRVERVAPWESTGPRS